MRGGLIAKFVGFENRTTRDTEVNEKPEARLNQKRLPKLKIIDQHETFNEKARQLYARVSANLEDFLQIINTFCNNICQVFVNHTPSRQMCVGAKKTPYLCAGLSSKQKLALWF